MKKQAFGAACLFLGGLGLSLAISAQAAELSEEQRTAIIDRIQLKGEVCLEGDDKCAAASAPAAAASSGPRAADEIYSSTCFACHGTGAAGAPKLGDAGAWAPRIAQGMDSLVGNAIKGINGMPPKGTCGSCSDDEIKAVVQYMVDNSK